MTAIVDANESLTLVKVVALSTNKNTCQLTLKGISTRRLFKFLKKGSMQDPWEPTHFIDNLSCINMVTLFTCLELGEYYSSL